jgi:hypothetical protein
MIVAKWHVRRTSRSPKALSVALSFYCLLRASAPIPTKQRPYAFWGLPALAFALHGWQQATQSLKAKTVKKIISNLFEGIIGRVKFLLLAWAGMPKTSFRKNSDFPKYCEKQRTPAFRRFCRKYRFSTQKSQDWVSSNMKWAWKRCVFLTWNEPELNKDSAHDGRMKTLMNDTQLETLDQIRQETFTCNRKRMMIPFCRLVNAL